VNTVLLRPEGDITALRVIAHIEAGDQVIFEGDMMGEPWWPASQDTVYALLRRNETGT
jgi:hypothetical protein